MSSPAFAAFDGEWCLSVFSRIRYDAFAMDLDAFLVKYRRTLELLAVAGCGLILAHAVALFLRVTWPAATLLWILIIAPVCTGLLTLRILAPGAYHAGLFASEIWSRWSRGTRLVVKLVLRVGWTGYAAVFFAFYGLSAQAPAQWHRSLDVADSLLISLLYASQVLVLHFGRVRDPVSRTSR